jgi:hypothetical protein
MDDSKIKIAVCGDSFCAASNVDLAKTGTGPRAHFSHILEDQYGYEVLHLAHGGFSNTGIMFQIQHAVQSNVDAVVYNKTWANRVEIVLRDNRFRPEAGLKNFVYFDLGMPSTGQPFVGDKNSPIFSTVWQGLEENTLLKHREEQLLAVNLYLKHLFDYNLQNTIDTWLFEYWYRIMLDNQILPLCFNDADVGKVAYDFSEKDRNYDTPFHTDRATQETVAANIHVKIQKHLDSLK